MSKGLKDGERNGRDVYPDIIDHPHWQSPVRPHMSLYDRAAQFSSFDALAGYSDMIREEQRITDEQVHPEEYELEVLNQKLTLIADALRSGRHPELSFSVFVPDEHKAGGRYETVFGSVKKIDPVARKMILTSTGAEDRGSTNRIIAMDRIIAIHGEQVNFPDDME
jgi:hypothetical protein